MRDTQAASWQAGQERGASAHGQHSLFGLLAGLGFDSAEEWLGIPRFLRRGFAATSRAIVYLVAARVMTRGRCSLVDAERLALAELSLRYGAVASTETKVTREVVRFFRYLRARELECLDEITTAHVAEFVWAASRRYGRFADVSATTAANRQSFLRTLFAALSDLGVWSGGDVVGKPIRRSDGDASRPLTETELHQVHVEAYGGLVVGRTPLLVAFAEAGGDASEIATVTTDDVDLTAGTVRFTGRAERTNPLNPWALAAIATVFDVEHPQPNERVCVGDRLPVERAAHSVTVRLREMLRDAGLAGRARVTPKSIRLAAAQAVLMARGIEAAARFLGNESLDATARALDHRWWDQ
ncbi:MAG: site-specific integrase [Actinomycetota bacterium]|nr:site-specific integrase [Actinomycetota bacterium]